MGRLIKRYEQLQKALITYEKALTKIDFELKKYHTRQITIPVETFCQETEYEDVRSARDSLVQRFEYTFELFWKYLKDYLEDVVQIDEKIANGPNTVISLSCDEQLCSEEERCTLRTMLQERNLTTHMYKEELAEQFIPSAPNYYTLMKKIADRLKP